MVMPTQDITCKFKIEDTLVELVDIFTCLGSRMVFVRRVSEWTRASGRIAHKHKIGHLAPYLEIPWPGHVPPPRPLAPNTKCLSSHSLALVLTTHWEQSKDGIKWRTQNNNVIKVALVNNRKHMHTKPRRTDRALYDIRPGNGSDLIYGNTATVARSTTGNTLCNWSQLSKRWNRIQSLLLLQ